MFLLLISAVLGGVYGIMDLKDAQQDTSYDNKYPYPREPRSGTTAGDFRVLARLALLENKIEGVEADYGYGKIFAMHLQSNETPVCPVGTFKLWVGYSLVKAFDGSGYIDLSDPGSCMRKFDPVPHVLCRGRKCRLRGNNWKSTWLWNRNPHNRNGEIMASRCSVCESAKTLLVVHSQNETVPDCPMGYTSQHFWSGFSFISAGQSGKVSLSSIGSCLPYFESSPFIECNGHNECRVVQASNVWLRVAHKEGGKNTHSRDTISAKEAWRKISRCRICALYTPTLWPRDRHPIGEEHNGFK
ncbi:collagen alpha-2(IV) chain-like [Bolinopsis microptera]|uniref:collagen alpha-2(IV) chain-like n=1 Tax=Bolinopsis microptera TaxID=2820187 RepID=UPI00307AF4C4